MRKKVALETVRGLYTVSPDQVTFCNLYGCSDGTFIVNIWFVGVVVLPTRAHLELLFKDEAKARKALFSLD